MIEELNKQMLIPSQPTQRSKNEKSVHQLIQQPLNQKSFQPVISRPVSHISKARYATNQTLELKNKLQLQRTDTDRNILDDNN
jgi:hypothetical protein